MKRAIIVHCWGGDPEYCWYPQTKKELEGRGFEVIIPAMPDTEHPRQDAWVSALREIVKIPDRDTYLIGHSIGCAAILRYLESLEEGETVGGVILVAGFAESLGLEEIENFFITPLNLERIKTRAEYFVAIHSTDDPFVDIFHGKTLRNKLGAELIIKERMKHFSGHPDQKESCLSLPDVAQAILKRK